MITIKKNKKLRFTTTPWWRSHQLQWKRDSQPKPGAESADAYAYVADGADAANSQPKIGADGHDGDAYHGAHGDAYGADF